MLPLKEQVTEIGSSDNFKPCLSTICLPKIIPRVQNIPKVLPCKESTPSSQTQLLLAEKWSRASSLDTVVVTGQGRGQHGCSFRQTTLTLGRGRAQEHEELSTHAPHTTAWEHCGKCAHTAWPFNLAMCPPPHSNSRFATSTDVQVPQRASL